MHKFCVGTIIEIKTQIFEAEFQELFFNTSTFFFALPVYYILLQRIQSELGVILEQISGKPPFRQRSC